MILIDTNFSEKTHQIVEAYVYWFRTEPQMLANKYLPKKLMPCFCTTFQFRWIGRKGKKRHQKFAVSARNKVFFPGLKEASESSTEGLSFLYVCLQSFWWFLFDISKEWETAGWWNINFKHWIYLSALVHIQEIRSESSRFAFSESLSALISDIDTSIIDIILLIGD